MDTDAVAAAGPGAYYRILRDFANGNIDILAGTQMLAKGLHFPNVTLVGIISADTSLYLPDFRANERSFQLLTQVAGRAGRSEKGGVVYVQTFLPDQPTIKFAMNHDFKGFVRAELPHRRDCNLPPFWRMAIIWMRDRKFDRLETACAAMRERLDQTIARNNLEIKLRGPIPATISRMHRYHRMQFIVQTEHISTIQRLFADIRAMSPLKPAVTVSVDIDPINLM